MRVHVTRRDRGHSQSACQALARSVALLVLARVGALQLHPQPVEAERVQQPPSGRLVFDAVPVTAGQADQSLGVLEHRLQRHRRLPGSTTNGVTRICMRASEQPAQVPPPGAVADEQREVPLPAALRAGSDLDGDLRAEDRTDWVLPIRGLTGGHRQLHRSRQRVVIGNRESGVPEPPARAISSCGRLVPSKHE